MYILPAHRMGCPSWLLVHVDSGRGSFRNLVREGDPYLPGEAYDIDCHISVWGCLDGLGLFAYVTFDRD